jgi:uncharacterized Zn finger protein (UPF0148 family)
MKKEYHCPRCKTKKILEYEKTLFCPICELRFEKKDFEIFDDDQILAISEKKDISSIIYNDDDKDF